jgi:hypothetical protein
MNVVNAGFLGEVERSLLQASESGLQFSGLSAEIIGGGCRGSLLQ